MLHGGRGNIATNIAMTGAKVEQYIVMVLTSGHTTVNGARCVATGAGGLEGALQRERVALRCKRDESVAARAKTLQQKTVPGRLHQCVVLLLDTPGTVNGATPK